MKTILTETEGGIVYNAKGDLTPGSTISAARLTLLNAGATATIAFNSDGLIYKTTNATTVSGAWADTDGSDDIPIDLNPWDGISNYTFSWEIMSETNAGAGTGTHNPPGIVGATGTATLFSATVPNGAALLHQVTYQVTITNNTTAASSGPYTINVSASTEP